MEVVKHIAQVMGWLGVGLLFAAPASTNYQLNTFGFGSGGVDSSSSPNYRLNATTGEQSGQTATSTNYTGTSGNQQTQQANVPPAPTFTNPANYYNKLKFIITTGSNPSDTKFAIAISSDNFTTTNYVQADDTVGPTVPGTAYQTYAAWGGASGQTIIGLNPATTYKIKVKAMQGNFTETQYGPSASAATVGASLSFDIDVAATDISTNPPYTLSLGSLLPAAVTTSTNKIWVSLDTNANSGGTIYISSAQGGLRSATAAYTIASATADLSSAASGVGIQNQSATQTSGSFVGDSPYTSSGSNVGIFNTSVRPIFHSTGPVVAGRGSFAIKAKAASTTPAAGDYTDTLTLIAAAAF